MCMNPHPKETFESKLAHLSPVYQFSPNAPKAGRHTVSVTKANGEVLVMGANSRERAAQRMCHALGL